PVDDHEEVAIRDRREVRILRLHGPEDRDERRRADVVDARPLRHARLAPGRLRRARQLPRGLAGDGARGRAGVDGHEPGDGPHREKRLVHPVERHWRVRDRRHGPPDPRIRQKVPAGQLADRLDDLAQIRVAEVQRELLLRTRRCRSQEEEDRREPQRTAPGRARAHRAVLLRDDRLMTRCPPRSSRYCLSSTMLCSCDVSTTRTFGTPSRTTVTSACTDSPSASNTCSARFGSSSTIPLICVTTSFGWSPSASNAWRFRPGLTRKPSICPPSYCGASRMISVRRGAFSLARSRNVAVSTGGADAGGAGAGAILDAAVAAADGSFGSRSVSSRPPRFKITRSA